MAAFQDSFNRADEDLETSANWDYSGSAGAAAVRSNQLAAISSSSGFSYLSPDKGSADHYTQIRIKDTFWASFLCVRAAASSTYIGARPQTSSYQLYKAAPGFTLLGSYATTCAVDDVMYIEASGNNISVKINGTLRIGPVAEALNNTVTRQGLQPRETRNPIGDDYEADVLAAGGGISVPVVIWHLRQQGIA